MIVGESGMMCASRLSMESIGRLEATDCGSHCPHCRHRMSLVVRMNQLQVTSTRLLALAPGIPLSRCELV